MAEGIQRSAVSHREPFSQKCTASRAEDAPARSFPSTLRAATSGLLRSEGGCAAASVLFLGFFDELGGGHRAHRVGVRVGADERTELELVGRASGHALTLGESVGLLAPFLFLRGGADGGDYNVVPGRAV